MSLSDIKELIQTYGWTVVGVIAVLSGIVELAPIKINPWSAVAGWLGRKLSKDVITGISVLEKQQNAMKKQLDEHIEVDDRRDADMRRQRILRFNADIMSGKNFTHEYYCDMLVEIDTYKKYCVDHPEYPNSRAEIAIENIQQACREHERKNDWGGAE